MRKVNIFISSTCYDLSQIRLDLRDFITSLGHNPILSEDHDFPINPNLSNAENCINAVKTEADIFILIIGNRYGCILETGKSITNTEFLTAVEKGIPIYTFTLKDMLNILPAWEKNPDADFSWLVDNNNIFKFIQDVRKNSGLWNFPFEQAQDIKTTLNAQLSNLFNDSLQVRNKVNKLGNNELYSKISSKALSYLLNKGPNYETKFYMQCMYDEVSKYKDLKIDNQYSILVKSSHNISNFTDYINWCRLKLGQVINITHSLSRLIHEALPYFYAEQGIPSDIDGLYYTAQTYGRLYASLLEWSIEVKSVVIEETFKESLMLLAELAQESISKIECYPSESLQKMKEAEELYSNYKQPMTINLKLSIKIDDELIEKHRISLQKLKELTFAGDIDN